MSEREQSTGELADEILHNLTIVEETLGQLQRGNSIHSDDLRDSVENLSEAQGNASEILQRYEREEGPI